jgi:hypothetical protein
VEQPVQIGQPTVPLTAPVVPLRGIVHLTAPASAVPLLDSLPNENCADFPDTGDLKHSQNSSHKHNVIIVLL